ncbi:uncharacterized protein LOC101239849 [Hydra vulgaris]|uniref:uncharacterized protein LOC101239849 n=1 Tax=Hydra vulgaris TaxID=6087 RepID=UPI001F5EE075|nr:uncharacterized protein LOC101239849 isoform X1 [Hydra vulgaris]
MKTFWSIVIAVAALCSLVKNDKVSTNCNLKFYGCNFDYKTNQCFCHVQQELCSNPFQFKTKISCLKQHRSIISSTSSYCNQQLHGCYYETKDDQCYCKTHCSEEKEKFTFSTAKECMEATNFNPCKNSSHCENGGKCEVLKRGKFRCDCTGTKSYGEKCQKKCPDASHLTLTSMQKLYEENKDWWQNTQFSCLF